MTTPTAHISVDSITGDLVLHSPDDAAVVVAINKHNCKATLEANADRVTHFLGRMTVTGRTASEVVIVIINVDTDLGGPLADALMPGADWQAFRDAGQVPFARGLAGRAGIEALVSTVNAAEADRLRRAAETTCVVIVDHGVVSTFDARTLEPLR